jgi:trigger factor
MAPMELTITPGEATGVERRIQVSVPSATFEKAQDKAARKYASRVRLPGFRPGKAPTMIVRKRFGEAIRQEALEQLVNEAFQEVVKREELDLAAQPHVHDLKLADGEPVTFELHCEVRPKIELATTDGFTITRKEAAVTDEALEEQLEKLREQRAAWTPVEEKPAEGDLVTVDLATADADGTLPEAKEYRLALGGGQAIPGIEELVMEAAPGETVERSVKWPDDFPDESQRGVSKLARVTLKEVKRKTLPALDDAFAREVGDFESLEAMRAGVREDMERHAQREADAEVRGQLIDALVEANPFEVPQAWVAQVVDGYAGMYQIPDEEKARFAEQFKPMALKQVQRDVLVDALAERESLKATEDDVDAKVEEIATARGANPGEVYAQLQKGGRLAELEREITEERVFAWLLERNPVTAG